MHLQVQTMLYTSTPHKNENPLKQHKYVWSLTKKKKQIVYDRNREDLGIGYWPGLKRGVERASHC